MEKCNFYCRGECGDYTMHNVIDSNYGSPTHDCHKLHCVHEDAEPFVVISEKGKPPTQYSKRVEATEPEE
jgi:hypothetical protein